MPIKIIKMNYSGKGKTNTMIKMAFERMESERCKNAKDITNEAEIIDE